MIKSYCGGVFTVLIFSNFEWHNLFNPASMELTWIYMVILARKCDVKTWCVCKCTHLVSIDSEMETYLYLKHHQRCVCVCVKSLKDSFLWAIARADSNKCHTRTFEMFLSNQFQHAYNLYQNILVEKKRNAPDLHLWLLVIWDGVCSSKCARSNNASYCVYYLEGSGFGMYITGISNIAKHSTALYITKYRRYSNNSRDLLIFFNIVIESAKMASNNWYRHLLKCKSYFTVITLLANTMTPHLGADLLRCHITLTVNARLGLLWLTAKATLELGYG